jgi:alkylation response protein AidB-like acyl-CoA dehydrogenase
MDFSLNEDQTILLDGFRRFLEDEIRPIADETRDQFVPKERALEIQKKLVPFGVVNGMIAEEDGGMGLDQVTYGLLMHELARVAPDICITTQIYGITAKLMANTPQHLKDKYQAGLMACETVASVALSEPDGGSDMASIKLRAKKDGGHYILNGEKTWNSSGGYSDFMYVLARFIDGDTDEGLGLLLVERDHGYETADLKKTALNSQSTAQVFFNDVKVPAENVVVPAPNAMKSMMGTLSMSRPIVTMMALGIAQAALDEALSFAKDRKQFGGPIAGKQMIQDKLATMATKIEAGKLMALKSLSQIDAGTPDQKQVAMTKWYGTELACEVVYDAVQIHGASGIIKEYLVEYLHRAVRVFPFTEGTTEVQKLIIGRILTGISAF